MSQYTISSRDLPNLKLTTGGNPRQSQPLTQANLEYVLKQMGLQARHNVMLGTVQYYGEDVTEAPDMQLKVDQKVRDVLAMCDVTGINALPDVLNVAGQDNSFHPMQDWIEEAEWDGEDRFAELVATVPTKSPMWPVYLRRWLIQAVQAVRGWEDGYDVQLPHVLVFNGPQGCGKGMWIRALTGGRFSLADAELHLNSYGAKDQVLDLLRWPIVELSELDASFRKSDVSSLKAFLSRTTDTIRAPYARSAVTRPRVTVFAGSVNDLEFLNDSTGSRRFWPVRVEGMIDWQHKIDMQQLWAQANHWWCEEEAFTLTLKEEGGRVAEAADFTRQSPAVDLVEGYYLDFREQWDQYAILNKTEIMTVTGVKGNFMAAGGDVNQWLHENLGEARKLQGRQRSWSFPVGVGMHTQIKRVSEVDAKRYARWYTSRKTWKS